MSAKGTKKTSGSPSKPQKKQIIEGTTIKEFADGNGILVKEVIEKINSKGLSISANDLIDEGLSQVISSTIGKQWEFTYIEDAFKTRAESNDKELIARPPVVTIMGHVDHGKTTLLDAIRESNIVGKESGGITQHIGAYRITHKGRSITFIDTPGHEAFTQLRARGAKTTDIVILVVAADDGVMPQTKEAIAHAKAADVPIIVAINKIDKAEADTERVKQQLSKEGLVVEEWGGDIVSVDISAKEKKNLEDLLEMVLLVSDLLELKGNPNVFAQGVVLEARLDPKKGPIATVIIQHGILEQGNAFISGFCYGKAKALFDENGKGVKQTELSMPVEILGFSDVPAAGDLFQVVSDMEAAKKISQFRLSWVKKQGTSEKEHLTLDQLFKDIEEGQAKELPLIIKADVHGSAEVLSDILPNLSTDQVKINILQSTTGKITESDINLASASNGIILGYNTKPSQAILALAKKENVEIRSYDVIYHLTEDIKNAMRGLLEPVEKETRLGKAAVKKVFRISKVGLIAGCLVTEGKITRNAKARVIRDEEVVYKGRISSLKHLQNNVTEVKKGSECGIGLENFKDINEGDTIEAFITEKIAPE